jgi:hypothetical protein
LLKTPEKVIKIVKCLHLRLSDIPFFPIAACTVFLSAISLKSPSLLFCLLVGSFVIIMIQQIGQQVNLSRRSRILLQISAAVVIFLCLWLDYFIAPANAQFFKRAEEFFKNTLTQGSTSNSSNNVIALIFNVLRAIYLLYIAVSLVGVINALRKDEDWQSVARIPLLVVVAVTIADVLTGFVIGDSSK